MLNVQPVTLTDGRIRLEPLSLDHVDALKAAAADGELWKLRVTSVPDPDDTRGYVERALAMREQGNRLPFVVVDLENADRIIGCTSYHDIVPAIDRLEIGWTWYAKSTQRSHVNTCAKLLRLLHRKRDIVWPIAIQCIGWTHCARQDNGLLGMHCTMQKIRRLLHRVRSVRDDDGMNFGIVLRSSNAQMEPLPNLKAHIFAINLGHLFAHDAVFGFGRKRLHGQLRRLVVPAPQPSNRATRTQK